MTIKSASTRFSRDKSSDRSDYKDHRSTWFKINIIDPSFHVPEQKPAICVAVLYSALLRQRVL